MASVSLDVQPANGSGRVARSPPLVDEPDAELLDRPQVVIACLLALAGGANLGELLFNVRRPNVGDRPKATTEKLAREASASFCNMFARDVAGSHLRLKVIDV